MPGGVPFGVYAIIQNFNIPIQVQPQCFGVLSIVAWVQILMYSQYVAPHTSPTHQAPMARRDYIADAQVFLTNSNWATWKATALGIVVTLAFAGIEAVLILTLRVIYERGNETPPIVVGIIASILLAAGLVPPYGEIWKRRGRVVGIDWVFLSMDCSGAFFSLMALVAQNTFDILGGVLYIIW